MKSYHTDNHITLHHGDALDVLRTLPDASVHAIVTDPPSGIAFMNMAWDDDRGGRAQWVAWLAEIMHEAYRVLKPGAHGLVWALPRTSHWTACALEDAGFEIREKVYHLQGAGFPKALDVSKAIDAELGATREVAGMEPRSATRPHVEWGSQGKAYRLKGDTSITAPATPEAAQWDGYKTALKPAAEEWILIRKPISERNVARNVLAHGTGGLNVDACRVGTRESEPQYRPRSDSGIGNGGRCYGSRLDVNRSYTEGRYPPHVVFSHAPDCTEAACVEGCPVRALGEQSGVTPSSARPNLKGKKYGSKHMLGMFNGEREVGQHDDIGTAARFFPVFRYQAKPAPSERAGSTHPTQKSLALMEWLVKLVTAPDQTVLDCFMGSGTTGVAALRAGRQFVGVEMDAAYFAIAEQRITEEQNRPKQLDMFGEEST
jgi:site-specific DNA-methyltransferase (adenine-specific)